MQRIKTYFPSNLFEWKAYSKVFWPIVLGSMLFATDGLIGNFMIGHINQGITAVAVINNWTAILIGTFTGTAAAGSIVLGQFYYAKKYDMVQQIAKICYLLTMSMATVFALIAWINPDLLINVFLKGKDSSFVLAHSNAQTYLKIIAIQWLLISITFNLGNQFREIGKGHIALYWGIGALFTSVILNSILLFVFHMGIVAVAWGTVAGRLVTLSAGIIIIKVKKLPIGFKPWTIFFFSRAAVKHFFKRWYLIFAFASVFAFINFRNYFYGVGYPVSDNSPLGSGIGALTIIGLSGAIMNIITIIFNALGAMASVFVGSELGKNNIKEAKRKSDQLRGFNTSMAFFLSIVLLIFAALIPYMSIFSNFKASSGTSVDHVRYLKHVRNALFTICFFYPMWVWFMSTYRNASTGGKGFWFAFTDWFVSGPIQLGYLAILVYGVMPYWPALQNSFNLCYFLFFLSDGIKLVVQEILYHKIDWLHSLVKKEHKKILS